MTKDELIMKIVWIYTFKLVLAPGTPNRLILPRLSRIIYLSRICWNDMNKLHLWLLYKTPRLHKAELPVWSGFTLYSAEIKCLCATERSLSRLCPIHTSCFNPKYITSCKQDTIKPAQAKYPPQWAFLIPATILYHSGEITGLSMPIGSCPHSDVRWNNSSASTLWLNSQQ